MAIAFCLTHQVGFFFEAHQALAGDDCVVDSGPDRPRQKWDGRDLIDIEEREHG